MSIKWNLGVLYPILKNRIFLTVHQNDEQTMYEIKKINIDSIFLVHIMKNMHRIV